MATSCPNCGRRTDRGERFCDACGAFLGWGAGESAESQLLPLQATPQREDQRAGVQLQIKSDSINVAPGNAESTNFTVKNLGTQVEEFRFYVTGPAWIVVEPTAMSVYPGQESTGALQAAPPRTPSSLAGVTPYQLTVRSAVHANVSASTAGRVDVAPYSELAAELVPTSSRGRALTRHHIDLDNRGNVSLRVALKATDVADGLRIGVPAFADVPPGRVIQVPVGVQGSRRWFGRPEPKTFAIIAEAPKPLATTRLSGTRIVDPVFPRWVPAAAAGLVVAAAAGAALIPRLGSHSTVTTSSSSAPPTTAPPTTAPPTTAPPTTAPPTTASPTTAPPTTAPSTTAPSSTPDPPPPPPPADLISAAPSAVWTSYSNFASPSVIQVQQGATGCQLGAGSFGTGAVLTVNQVVLFNGGPASTALETDPPSQANGGITGAYTFAPTATEEVFRAAVGFCSGVASGAQMEYAVFAGSAPDAAASGTLDASTGQMAEIQVLLPAGTTKIMLEVRSDPTATYGDVVWVNPRIDGLGAASSSPPSAQP